VTEEKTRKSSVRIVDPKYEAGTITARSLLQFLQGTASLNKHTKTNTSKYSIKTSKLIKILFERYLSKYGLNRSMWVKIKFFSVLVI
jgi:hypothetical protein